MRFIDYLNQNAGTAQAIAGIIQALVAALLVIPTVISIWIAWRALKETRAAARHANQSSVVVAVEINPISHVIGDLVIKNVGASPAHNLRVSVSPTDLPDLDGKEIGLRSVFRRSFPLLLEKQTFSTLLISFPSILQRQDLPKQLTFVADYEDEAGHKYSKRYSYDLEIYGGMQRFRENTLHDLVRQAEEITKRLKAIEDGVRDAGSELGTIRYGLPLFQPTAASPQSLLRYLIDLLESTKRDEQSAFLVPRVELFRSRLHAVADALSWHADQRIDKLQIKVLEIATYRFYLDGGESRRMIAAKVDEAIMFAARLLDGDDQYTQSAASSPESVESDHS